jgi:hypothetical protein
VITMIALFLFGERILDWAPAVGLLVALATGTALALAEASTPPGLPEPRPEAARPLPPA